jgi:hypothetical protein
MVVLRMACRYQDCASAVTRSMQPAPVQQFWHGCRGFPPSLLGAEKAV